MAFGAAFFTLGFNQHIIQRALARKLRRRKISLAEKKLLIRLLLSFRYCWLSAREGTDMARLAPAPIDLWHFNGSGAGGLRARICRAIAAIVSSLASMMNSISTIFTMDIYRDLIAPGRTEAHYVGIGRLTSAAAIVIAVILARPFLGGMESAFQAIQEYTGFIAPGIVSVFLLGMFWKGCNAQGAFAMLIVSVLANIALKFMTPDLAFVIRIWIVFLSCLVVGYLASNMGKTDDGRAIDLAGMNL